MCVCVYVCMYVCVLYEVFLCTSISLLISAIEDKVRERPPQIYDFIMIKYIPTRLSFSKKLT